MSSLCFGLSLKNHTVCNTAFHTTPTVIINSSDMMWLLVIIDLKKLGDNYTLLYVDSSIIHKKIYTK